MFKVLFVILSLLCINVTFAEVEFGIIPSSDVSDDKVKDVVKDISCDSSDDCNVWDMYKYKANEGDLSLAEKFATGVFTWEDVLDYIVYLVRFLSELGLLAGGLMIIYAGYHFLLSGLSAGDVGKGKKALKYAIIGVIALTFSYAIMRLLTEVFIE